MFWLGGWAQYIQRITSAPIDSNASSASIALPSEPCISRPSASSSFSFLEAFRWIPVSDKFEFPGYMNSYLLEQIIAIKRGIPPHKRKDIYSEVKRRARVLERLHIEKGICDFEELFKVLAEARRQKLL